jgi:hypothetical protein
MRGLKAKSAWLGQLLSAEQQAATANSLPELRRLASIYNVSLPGGKNLEVARNRVLQKLALLVAAERPRSRRRSAAPQGSTGSTSPACSSASSAQEQPEEASAVAAAAAAAATAAAAASQDAGSLCATDAHSADSAAEPATPPSSPPLPSLNPPSSPPPAPLQVIDQQAAVAEGECGGAATPPPAKQHAPNVLQPQPAACQQQPASQPSSADAPPPAEQPTARRAPPPRPTAAAQQCSAADQLASMESEQAAQRQQTARMTCQITELQLEVADLKRQLSQLQRQLTTTHSTGMRTSGDVTAMQEQLQKLLAASEQFAATRDGLSLLQSKQQLLQQRLQQGECASSVVLKCPKALPTEGAADRAQRLLQQLLQLKVTVLRVQPLHSSNSGSGEQRRHAYRIDLGSRGERTAVLRCKAQRLRGTPYSIDGLLTPEQRASKQQLQPVARQAKAAGRDVRWRYGQLLVDGKPYTGPGSVPAPAQQQATAASRGSQPAAPASPPQPADGFQTVKRRKPKAAAKPRSNGGSKKALFVPSAEPGHGKLSYAEAAKQQKAGQPAKAPPSGKAAAGSGAGKKQQPAKAPHRAKAAGSSGSSPQRQQRGGSEAAGAGAAAPSRPLSPAARA